MVGEDVVGAVPDALCVHQCTEGSRRRRRSFLLCCFVCVLCFVFRALLFLHCCPSCVWAVLLVCLGLAVALLVFGSLYYTGGGGES